MAAPATVSPATSRFDTIDVLRGVSILAVILLHVANVFRSNGFRVYSGLQPIGRHLLFSNGGNGVTVFFAVSGFLITITSLRRFGTLARMQPGIFYRIRFARIAPLLLLMLAVLSALHLLHAPDYIVDEPHASLTGALLSALTFTLNAYEAVHMHGWLPACWTVLWSLSIEEMFYLFFPVLSVLFFRRRSGKIMFVTLLFALMAVGCFARTAWAHGDDLAAENSYFGGFGLIACGVLAALAVQRLTAREKPIAAAVLIVMQVLGALVIVLFALYPRWQWIRPFLHFTGVSGTDDLLLALGTSLVIVGSVLRNRAGRSWLSPLRWFGRHSYELYLAHEFVVTAVVNHYLKLQVTHNPGPLLAWTAAILVLCIPVAWLLARFFSEPLNRALRGARPPQTLS